VLRKWDVEGGIARNLRKLHSEVLHNLNSLLNIIRMMKSRRRWMWNVACTRSIRVHQKVSGLAL
jgi:hypothetical protein